MRWRRSSKRNGRINIKRRQGMARVKSEEEKEEDEVEEEEREEDDEEEFIRTKESLASFSEIATL